jgi:chemotaxis protein CheC
MKFGNDFSGRALLIFPAQKAKLLVDACMGMEMSDYDEESYELIDTDFDVLKEISNVILNSVIGEFSNLIGTTVEFSIPDIEVLFVSQDEQKMYLKNDVYMMMLYTSFELAEAQVEGVIIVALGLTSLNKLLDKISEEIGDAL